MISLELLVFRVLSVALLVLTVYSMLWSLSQLALVVGLVVAMSRYMDRRSQSLLPAKGRVILITGCDTGIGHDTAIMASHRGLTVVATCLDSNSSGAQRLASMERIHVIQLDVTHDDSIASAVADVTKLCGDKGLWAVINNAGFNRQSPVELTSMHTFHTVADVMLFGTVRVTKAFLPLVRRAKGRVLTMSSDRGMLTPAHSAAYCIAKHGVEAFSDVLRAEMARFDVTVSIIQPGHFGVATAIINPENVLAMQQSMERDLETCSQEVQSTYGGQEAVKGIIDQCVASRDTACADTQPVVLAIMHAVLDTSPSGRYPVHGTTSRIDWGLVLGQVQPVLPEWLLNWVGPIAMKSY